MTQLTLVHVPVSHYSEKARWALDYKRIPHKRRWPPGGFHPLVTFIVTRGKHQTVPALLMDGEGIGDSTEIIRRLEERFPDRPLYPADPAERARALALEEFFDEELGPQIRQMAYHHLTADPEALAELTMHQVQYGHRATLGMNKRIITRFLDLRFSTADSGLATESEGKVVAVLDRLEAELDGREYLVGESFSVADLTAAALLYPLILPPQTPWQPSRLPDALGRFSVVAERPPGDQVGGGDVPPAPLRARRPVSAAGVGSTPMDPYRGLVGEELSRRDLLRHATVLGSAGLIASALPVAERILAAHPAYAAVSTDEATMQAFADTIIPGRKAVKTDLGDEIHPDAIAGVDPEPGAVEADVMRLYHHPLTGFDVLEPAFLTELSSRSLRHGGPFLGLGFDQRTAVVLEALSLDNDDRVLYEAAAAVPFTAFCAAAIHPVGTWRNASGYRVMGYPGAAPQGYRKYSYGRKLARDFTRKGYLP